MNSFLVQTKLGQHASSSRSTRARRALVWGLGAWMSGCASSASPPPATSASASESAPPPAEVVAEEPVCVDDQDQKVECLSDTDCCAGFVCGKDPDLNPRTNYCVYGG